MQLTGAQWRKSREAPAARRGATGAQRRESREAPAARRGASGFRRQLAVLLGVCLLGAPAFAGVLPDDRADVLYHRYQGGGITIQGPEVLVRKKVGDNLSLSASYYEDLISSASIDVKLSASPYHEKRKQETFGFDYLHGKSTYSAGVIHSKEPDYHSDTSYYSVSQDMFGDLTTVSMTYKRGWDRVFADIKDATTGQIINQPSFGGFDSKGNPIPFRRAEHKGYAVGLTQILTRSLIASFNYEVLEDEGFLASPYRKIRYLSPGQGKGFTLADQIYPATRTSNAASIDLKYYLPYRAALDGSYRYFTDTWGIRAHTGQVTYTQPVWVHWILDGTFRVTRQSAASFYSDLFPFANSQNFMARDRELAAFNSYAIGAGLSYEFKVAQLPWINKSSLNLRLDHLMIDYSNFRNALLTDPANGITAGNEPLYKLNANVLQLFFSIWF